MTVKEFAERIRVSPRTAERIIAAGHIDWTDIGTGGKAHVRISESAFARYLKSREQKGRKMAEAAQDVA